MIHKEYCEYLIQSQSAFVRGFIDDFAHVALSLADYDVSIRVRARLHR